MIINPLGQMLGCVQSWVRSLIPVEYLGLSDAGCGRHRQHPKVLVPMEILKGLV